MNRNTEHRLGVPLRFRGTNRAAWRLMDSLPVWAGRWGQDAPIKTSPKSVRYSWWFNGNENFLRLTVRGEAQPLRAGSEQEFITEHYWGYTAQRDGSTLEYQVEHPRWRVWESETAELHCDIAGLYGEQFCEALSCRPASAFLAEGSAVTVRKGVRLVSQGVSAKCP